MKRGLALLTALLLTLGCVQGFGTPAMAQNISGWKGPTGHYLTAAWPGTFAEGGAAVRSADGSALARLYREANAEGEILMLYYDGVQPELISRGEDGWAQVRLGMMEGYMQTADLAFDQESLPKSAIPQMTIDPGDPTGTRVRTVPTAPLREMPSSSARTIASYAKGVSALLLGYCDGWCQVLVDKKIGFLQSKFLYVNPAPSTVDNSIYFDGSGYDGTPSYAWDEDYEDVVPEAGTWPFYPDGARAPVYYSVGTWTVQDPSYNAAVYNPDPNDHLNLREEPDERSVSQGKYFNGARVIVHYIEEDIGWAFVSIGTLSGFMKMNFLEFESGYGYPASAMPLMYAYNPNSSGTYLLDARSTASYPIAAVPNGTPVTVMGYSDGWLHVIVDGRIGFLPTAYAASVYNPSPIPETFSWGGPVGAHSVADWPLGYTGMTVNNPNPKDRLNLRTSPSSTAGSRGKYYNGVQVTVQEILAETGWAKVTIGSLSGYMDMDFLSTGYVASAMPVLVTTSQVHLRSGMSTKTTSLEVLPKGTQVILMGFTSQWAHVIVNGRMGFIYAKYVK